MLDSFWVQQSITAVVGTALVFFAVRHQRHHGSLWTWPRFTAAGLLVMGIGLPALFGLPSVLLYRDGPGPWVFWHELRSPATLVLATTLVSILSAYGVLVWQVVRGRWLASLSSRQFLIGALCVFAGLRFAYLLSVEIDPILDPKRMWDLATTAADQGWPEGLVYPQKQRILPYFLPLATIFGDSSTVYELSNLLVSVSSATILFVLARRWYGENAARGALLLIIPAPETFFLVSIPSHENPALLLT